MGWARAAGGGFSSFWNPPGPWTLRRQCHACPVAGTPGATPHLDLQLSLKMRRQTSSGLVASGRGLGSPWPGAISMRVCSLGVLLVHPC